MQHSTFNNSLKLGAIQIFYLRLGDLFIAGFIIEKYVRDMQWVVSYLLLLWEQKELKFCMNLVEPKNSIEIRANGCIEVRF